MSSEPTDGPQAEAPPPFPVIRSGLPTLAPLSWLDRGLSDLKACGSASLFYGACYVVTGWLLIAALRHAVQLATAVTTGFMILAPFLAMGLYELSRLRERSEPLSLRPSLTVWRRNAAAVGIYSLVLIVLYLVWARASLVVFALFYTGGMPTLESFIAEISRLENLEFLVAYVIVGGVFATLAFAFSVISLPLILDRKMDAITAMIASFLALVRNIPAMAAWGSCIALLGLLGMATGMFGLAITMPLLGHATWHAYRDIAE
jgi:uncharacterized membrane protein